MNVKQHNKIVNKLNGKIDNQLGEIRNLKAFVEDCKTHSSNMAKIGRERFLDIGVLGEALNIESGKLLKIKSAPWTTRLKWLFTGVK